MILFLLGGWRCQSIMLTKKKKHGTNTTINEPMQPVKSLFIISWVVYLHKHQVGFKPMSYPPPFHMGRCDAIWTITMRKSLLLYNYLKSLLTFITLNFYHQFCILYLVKEMCRKSWKLRQIRHLSYDFNFSIKMTYKNLK